MNKPPNWAVEALAVRGRVHSFNSIHFALGIGMGGDGRAFERSGQPPHRRRFEAKTVRHRQVYEERDKTTNDRGWGWEANSKQALAQDRRRRRHHEEEESEDEYSAIFKSDEQG